MKGRKHKLIYDLGIIRFFFLLLGTIGCSNALAQTNPYKIDDELYNYWHAIYKNAKSEDAQLKIDTLISMCIEKEDVKAHCMAFSLRTLCYYMSDDLENTIRSKDEAVAFIEQTPYKQYIFDTWNRLINFYINKQLPVQAISELKLYQAKAYELNNDYGITHVYRKMGDLYATLFDNTAAIEQYQKSIEAMKERSFFLEYHDIFLSLSEIYMKEGKWGNAKRAALEANRYAEKNNLRRIDNPAQLTIIYALEGIHADSVEYYYQKMQEQKEYMGIFKSTIQKVNLAENIYTVFKGHYALIYDLLDNETQTVTARRLISEYFALRTGDYNKAYYYLKEQLDSFSVQVNLQNRQMITQMTSQNENMALLHEKEQLELRTAQMALQQSISREQLMASEQEKNHLELKNQQLLLERQRVENDMNALEVEKAKAMLESEQEQSLRQKDKAKLMAQEISLQRMKMQILIIVAVLIIAFVTIVYVRNQRQKSKLLFQKKTAEAAQRIAEEQREIAEQERAKAESADKLKSLFLQNMSHEIRTPLNAIVGFNEVLNGEYGAMLSEADRKEFLRLIVSNTELLTTLINDILDLSKLESGVYDVNITDVPVKEICQNVLGSVKDRAKEQVELRLTCSNQQPNITIRSDSQRLQQLLLNYLTNACKYTEKGNITLDYEIHPYELVPKEPAIPSIIFSVTDTGCGICEEDADKVFNRFEKLSSFKQGSGLGLNICSRISELLGGKVFVDKSYKNGSRFVFVHPLNC